MEGKWYLSMFVYVIKVNTKLNGRSMLNTKYNYLYQYLYLGMHAYNNK